MSGGGHAFLTGLLTFHKNTEIDRVLAIQLATKLGEQ